jgi:hypothetical protein
MHHLLLPKTKPNLDPFLDVPLIFLAGPIRGGGDWQKVMMEKLMTRFTSLIVVNPSRYQADHSHYHLRIDGEDNHFPHQTAWEAYFLEKAARGHKKGCVIFWLGDQKEPRGDGQYARETLGELGAWRTHKFYDSTVRLIVGYEKKFPGLEQILKNFTLALPDFSFHETMDSVVEATFLCCNAP